ncbi:MAG: hypothetical protein MUP55_02740 [Candidatus Aenigmarchaeota archaeon]|nr:hypothetical protein [Candidatus Aenigmarchaeota archaeon]
MVGEAISERLVFNDRIDNVKTTIDLLIGDSIDAAVLNLGFGFGRNNRRLLGLRDKSKAHNAIID